MKTQHAIYTFLITALVIWTSVSESYAQEEQAIPRVLILGDSISIGYTPFVQEMLKDEVFVTRPKANCAGTNNGIKHIDRWLKAGTGNWDVIHFNFGLHDLKRVNAETGKNSNNPDDPHQASPEQYEKQLREIVQKLNKTNAKLIFATTTPVPVGGVKPYRDVTDPEKYNDIARKIMRNNGVSVNDLYTHANSKLKDIQRPVNVHFTKEGSQFLAEQVVQVIREALGNETASTSQPNILWIIVEDMSAHFSCYGEKQIKTPHVDQLAAEGIQFSKAFVTAPVCSAARSALITGMYQTSIGVHHHRSGRGPMKITLPENVVPVPELFKQAGYYTCNGEFKNHKKRIAKTDYNFTYPDSLYDGNDWSARKPGQPFFAQIQLKGGKIRHSKSFLKNVQKQLGGTTSAEGLTLPPYLPNDLVILEDWASYLDTVRYTDFEVGQILKRLEDEKLTENTYVFFITDHGISHVRAKQFCYEAGIHIPFVVRGPNLNSGTIRDDLTAHIDMATTSLALAGIDVPENMEGRDLFDANRTNPDYVVSARDRCDETVDYIRSVRSSKFKYIRNYLPKRPYLQPNTYKDNKPIQIKMRQLYAEGKLNPQQSLIMQTERPDEELYDLTQDPHELNNLVSNPDYSSELDKHRKMLAQWIAQTGDEGQNPESDEMYDSDMQAYLSKHGRNVERAKQIKANIQQMKDWKAVGK